MTVPGQARSWLPPLYVVLFGSYYGGAIALAKTATASGIPPLAFAFWQPLGAGAILLLLGLARGVRPRLASRHMRYYLIAGFISNALPTTLAYLAVGHIGAGVTGLVYALSPLFTYAVALPTGFERFDGFRLGGLLLGLAGALVIVLPNTPFFGGEGPESDFFWPVVAFTIPLWLGIGNVYRSADWPAGANSLALAAGMLLSSAAMILPVMMFTNSFYFPAYISGHIPGLDPIGGAASADWTIAAVIALSTLGFIIYFELQRMAGPVYFSMVSYAITASAMVIGVGFFGERPGLYVWAAVGLIFCGVFLVNRRQGKA